ncbi:MAG TPA: protein kinase [Gammaproteobacteria bacterium]|nr:protein kinase [Gammaproteobacteria bacterium]
MWRRLSFTTRILLVSALLVILALATTAAITYSRGNRIATKAANDALEHSRLVQQNFQQARFQRLHLMSRLLANDPYFISYVANAVGGNLFGGGGVDTRSISDLLHERETELGFDFSLVLDGNGQVLTGSDRRQPAQEDLSAVPVIGSVLDSQTANTGYWLRNGQAFQVAIEPLANHDEFLGYLLLALRVDSGLLQRVKQVSSAEVAVLNRKPDGYAPIVATLADARLQALQASLQQHAQLPTGKVFALDLAGERWLAYMDPLGGSKASGFALTLTSYDSAMHDFRSILTEQAVTAVAVALIAVLLALWLSPRLARPLRELADAAQAAARGEFKARLEIRGSGEIAQLTQAFDSLLSDLREKDEIENYMADLAKYLPDAGAGETAVKPSDEPTQLPNAALLAVELRTTGVPNTMARKALEQHNQILRNLEAAAHARGGHIASVAGGRLFLVFGDAATPGALVQVLACAAHIRALAANQGLSLCLALGIGSVVTGSATWLTGSGGSVLGTPVQQLEKLLPEAAPDTVLVTPDVARLLADRHGIQFVQVAGSASGRTMLKVEYTASVETGSTEDATLIAQAPAPEVEAPRLHLLPGMILGNRYEILGELGSGGMAVVYKAHDRQLGEFVALKTLRTDLPDSEALLEAMKSEIRLARKITHRNVLRIHDFGEIENVPFISMEYVRGMTLQFLLKNRERLPLAAGLRIMRQICTALQVAHEQSILHRDIKPANVMLEPSGNAKLMDFGIASPIRRGDDGNQERMILGTPRYAPPEQLMGQPLDERADIYACGVMMYQMFTGRMPFNERDLDRLVAVKIKEEYPAPSQALPKLAPELEALIVDCLRTDRERRPRSAQKLLSCLEGIHV